VKRLPPPIITLIGGILIVLIDRVFPSVKISGLSGRLSAAIFFVLGTGILLWSAYRLQVSKTTVDPLNPELTTSLVTSGPYRFSRNPMYLAMVLWLWAAFVFVGNWIGLSVVLAVVIYFDMVQIAAEEAVLEVKFGDEYHSYAQRVRKWI